MLEPLHPSLELEMYAYALYLKESDRLLKIADKTEDLSIKFSLYDMYVTTSKLTAARMALVKACGGYIINAWYYFELRAGINEAWRDKVLSIDEELKNCYGHGAIVSIELSPEDLPAVIIRADKRLLNEVASIINRHNIFLRRLSVSDFAAISPGCEYIGRLNSGGEIEEFISRNTHLAAQIDEVDKNYLCGISRYIDRIAE